MEDLVEFQGRGMHRVTKASKYLSELWRRVSHGGNESTNCYVCTTWFSRNQDHQQAKEEDNGEEDKEIG